MREEEKGREEKGLEIEMQNQRPNPQPRRVSISMLPSTRRSMYGELSSSTQLPPALRTSNDASGGREAFLPRF